ncbi:MAG: Rieske 2Fe-2S domain-containing protein [Acidobacteria bacterium]|nr:Rieske 2Fe-2S domain-containing protein [Acidobacteriota bacterium]
MRITSLGHAGMLIDTKGVSILCDPWFEPAFFGSWFPFPRNDRLDPALLARLEKPTYLYVSHIHGDHLDETWLANHVDKSTPVLLPDFPTRELERTLGKLGFRTFVRTQHAIAQPLAGGVSVAIHVETSITDGPGGDSALVVIDGDTVAVNQNDCRVHDIDALRKHGPVDIHLLQYSGAIWYPMVYDMPDADKRRLADAKVESQFARAVAYVESLNARVVVPSAGPPCFLDPELFHLNKVIGNEITIFPHQPEFIERLARTGKSAVLNMPGTTIDVTPNNVDITHPVADGELHDIWNNIGDHLAAYQADWAPWLARHKTTWHAPTDTLLQEIQKWFRPLMGMCPTVSVGIGGNVLIQTTGHDELGILLHFEYSDVQKYSNQPYRYRFEIQRELLETVVANKAVDWSNALFLSARFSAWRDGDFNENVYNFFKSLSSERMGRTEVEAFRKLTESREIQRDEVQVGDYVVERFCPHRQADLGTFGVIEGDELVCTLHGWRFDLASGACRSSVGKSVKIRKRT